MRYRDRYHAESVPQHGLLRGALPDALRNGTVHYIYWLVVHPDHAARGAIIRLAKECLALEADEGALLVFDTPETNERSAGGGFARMMERLAKMVGARAPVQLLEVQRYYAIDLASAPGRRCAPRHLRARFRRRFPERPDPPAGGVQRVVAPRS